MINAAGYFLAAASGSVYVFAWYEFPPAILTAACLSLAGLMLALHEDNH